MEKLTILENVKGKFGPQVKDAKGYLSFGKFYTGPTSFEPGTVVEATLFVGKTGSRYINELKLVKEPTAKETAKTLETTINMPSSMVVTKVLPAGGRDFDREARGKTVCQYIAAQLGNPSVDFSDLAAIVERAKALMEETFKV